MRLIVTLVLALVAAARAEVPDKAAEMVEQFMKDYDRAQATSTTAIGSHEQLAMLANLRDVLGLPKPELSNAETAQLERLIAVFPKLCGASGRFDHADLEPILKSVAEDLEQEVGAEILRRAAARVEPGSFGESLRRRAIEAHLERHGEAYLKHGLEEARRQVREGLGTYFHETGTASAAPETDEPRPITLDELRRFGEDVKVLRAIGRRSEARGLPRFTFPNGMSVADLRAIQNGEPPPSGQVVARR